MRRVPTGLCALLIVLGATLALSTPAAAAGGWSASGPAGGVLTVAIDPHNESVFYLGGPGGLWQSSDAGGTWQQRSTTALGHYLAVDPFAPNILYATAFTAAPTTNGGTYNIENRLLKSSDSGTSWTPVYQAPGPPTAGAASIEALLVDPNQDGAVFVALGGDACCTQVARSLDGGQTWALILPANAGAGSMGSTLASSLAALPGLPGLLDVGIIGYHGGAVNESTNAYATPLPAWSTLPAPPLTLTGPSHLALAGNAAQHSLYSVWTLMGVTTLARNDNSGAAVSLTASLPFNGPGSATEVDAIAVNPQQAAWLYAAMTRTGATQRGIFASPDAGGSWLALPALGQPVQQLALAVQPHMLLAMTASGLYRLTITWPVAAAFASYYQATDGLRLLGSAISPLQTVNGYPAQYYEKARLEDHLADNVPANWRYMDGLLVDELQEAQSPLPVGGDASTLTYAGLHALANPANRLPPPAGYAGGNIMVVGGGAVFVPFTTDLSGAAGHIVPARFWDYLNRADLFPGGWLHDVGLPISEAVTVQVTKDLATGPVQRTITVQAFQRTILTDDPANPPDWQIERANAGTDYRKAFAAEVGP